MRRREFIVGIGWATVTLAPVARAQGSGPIPVIAVLRGGRKDREFHRSDSLTGVLPAALKAMAGRKGGMSELSTAGPRTTASACHC